MILKNSRVIRRKQRVRAKISMTTKRTHRLILHKSSSHISCQIVDNTTGNCIVGASSMEKDLKSSTSYNCNKYSAQRLGDLIASRAKEKGIKHVVFDRGSRKYHGVVKAFCDSARSSLLF